MFYNLHFVTGEEDILEYFPCPFCYIEVEVPFLWSHLEEEHCFDFRNAASPLLCIPFYIILFYMLLMCFISCHVSLLPLLNSNFIAVLHWHILILYYTGVACINKAGYDSTNDKEL